MVLEHAAGVDLILAVGKVRVPEITVEAQTIAAIAHSSGSCLLVERASL
jgi:hypothetical protein